MRSESSDSACFLCRLPATSQFISATVLRYLHDASDGCGTYEISLEAIAQLHDDAVLKGRLAVAAAEAQRDAKVLQIGVDRYGQIQAYAVRLAGVQ